MDFIYIVPVFPKRLEGAIHSLQIHTLGVNRDVAAIFRLWPEPLHPSKPNPLTKNTGCIKKKCKCKTETRNVLLTGPSEDHKMHTSLDVLALYLSVFTKSPM